MSRKKITRVIKTYHYTAVKMGEGLQLQETREFLSLSPLSEKQKRQRVADMGFTFIDPGVRVEEKRYAMLLEAFIESATEITEV